MRSGYVLDFTNATFDDFFRRELGIDIYDDAYARGSGSKRKRLRAFLTVGQPRAIMRAVTSLWEYRQTARIGRGDPSPTLAGASAPSSSGWAVGHCRPSMSTMSHLGRTPRLSESAPTRLRSIVTRTTTWRCMPCRTQRRRAAIISSGFSLPCLTHGTWMQREGSASSGSRSTARSSTAERHIYWKLSSTVRRPRRRSCTPSREN